MMTDPIADLLTRIRNGVRIKSKSVRIPYTKLKEQVVEVLEREGYLTGHSTSDSTPKDGMGPQGWLNIDLKYGEEDEDVIEHIKRISRPGRRVYSQARDLIELPWRAAKTAVRCPRVRAERYPTDVAAVPPPSARLRRKPAVAHDVEAWLSKVVAPGIAARSLVSRVLPQV